MSPEQASGHRERLTTRSDIYSLGAVLYEMLTGQAPFSAGNTMAMLRKIAEKNVTPPRQIQPNIPRSLEIVVLTAMAKLPPIAIVAPN